MPDGIVCSTQKGKKHRLNLLSESAKIIKIQVAELHAVLADKVTRLQSLEKDLARKVEFIQNEEDWLIGEVNSIVKEQVDQITQEKEFQEVEISKYTSVFKGQAEALALQLSATTVKAREGINTLENITKLSVDGLMIEKFSYVRHEIEEINIRNYEPLWIPPRQLIPTGTFRSLEVKLEELSPCSIEYIDTVRTGDDWYYSVRWISSDLLVTGSMYGIEMWDSKLKLISSVKLTQCVDVVPYRNQLVVLQKLASDGTRIIKLYSQRLEKIRDIVKLPTKSNQLSQVAAADEKIVVSDPENMCVYVYKFSGEYLHTMHLNGMANPKGVFITTDGSLLVTDWARKGSVRKYQLSGDYFLIWDTDEMLYPWGIVEDDTGHLYVNRYNTNNNIIYQLSPEGELLKEMSCDQLKGNCTHGISVESDFLAVACREKGVRLFRFNFLN